jgi:hypothetical protein
VAYEDDRAVLRGDRSVRGVDVILERREWVLNGGDRESLCLKERDDFRPT